MNTCRRRTLRLRADDKRPHALSASAALKSGSARLTGSRRRFPDRPGESRRHDFPLVHGAMRLLSRLIFGPSQKHIG
ncbi:hypothetical protein [Microvirga sp. VF16]|uniref:hypothetical protein n=1 Tax=Microvirga sp. VF16 TaxID=2807101 RepID=UPI00193E048C|nr:hypothetical protein [Microvirga sp. VF16]QRM34951.1 hypothetical protein JO965_42590 [Microvirga sp. VF16]